MDVAALFARKAIAQTNRNEADAALAQVGLTHGQLDDPQKGIPIERYFALLEVLALQEQPEIGFHMRAARSMRCEDFGPIGLTIRAAPTLRRSFERLGRYARFYNPVSNFALEESGDTVLWTRRSPPATSDGFRISNEAAFGTFVALWRDANGDGFCPAAVQFEHRAIGNRAPLEAYFRCPVHHGAEIDAIVIRQGDLDQPNRIGDQHIWTFLSQHLAGLLDDAQPEQIDRQVVMQIARNLSEGVPRLDGIAREMGMSHRTLQRRLAEAGHKFQSLVDEARRETALDLVGQGKHSLAEVAFLTGFAEQSSFTRAFKRWSGKTPRAYRGETQHAAEARA
ncbi:AraC family transcriptional regulator [Novosphingobium sp. YJ-S2-02]|uniref:AraC family transcriptional regulator n=1 Tax=Novosphingobium aureum TaxID=2792964 RepID=A0A931HB93_9SPHN|nr:AraC family transcriptional regulator [Novosphingobium aureum]MBH0112594.1 AraC family transcriptional regulator [Novosphingobium aureum]